MRIGDTIKNNIDITDEEEIENDLKIPKKAKVIAFSAVLLILIATLIIALLYSDRNKTFDMTTQTFAKEINLSQPIISSEKKMINIGEEYEINLTTSSERNEEIRWESSAPEIISVNNGKIIGLSIGKAKIYAINGEFRSNELEIECFKKIQSIKLDKTEIELPVGEKETISANIVPLDATYKTLTWTSSDKNIAKVENGVVTGVNIGKCEIKAVDYTKEFELVCKVEVIAIDIENLALDETDVTLGKGQKYILYSSFTPENATHKDISWSSTDTNVIKVDNGKITAINTGTATVTITAHNGKKATCNFTVIANLPNYDVKYAQNEYNIRSGPGTDFSKIGSVKKNDELQILRTANGWSKVRTSDGTVGFIIDSAYSSTKTYFISNVPYINQFNVGYPTGCEAVSAAMAAQYNGYNVSPTTIVNNTPTDERGIWKEIVTIQISKGKALKCAVGELDIASENAIENSVSNNVTNNTIDNSISNNTTNNTVDNSVNNDVNNNDVNNNVVSDPTPTPTPDPDLEPEEPTTETKEVLYGGNPFSVFVGHPTKRLAEGSYGCFAGPIVTALNKSGISCTDISNCSRDTLLGYIREGKPVIVWCVKNAGDLVAEETWQYPDGSGSFTKLKGEHCAVLIGYDENNVYLNDPSAGENVKQPIEKFFSNWNQLYCQAIIIN